MNQKHLLQMLAVCVAVIGIGLAMVTVFGLAANSALLLGMLILCPLSHLLMMRSMSDNHESTDQEQNHLSSTIANHNKEESNVQNCH